MNRRPQSHRTHFGNTQRQRAPKRVPTWNAVLWIEPLEDRTLLSTIVKWNYTTQPNGGNWDTGTNWIGDNAPTSGDIAEIMNLNAGSTVYLNQGLPDSVDGLTTDSTVNLQIQDGSLSLGTGGSTSIGGALTVFSGATLRVGNGSTIGLGGATTIESGGTLNIGTATSVSIGGGETLNDAGTVNVSAGDAVSFGYSYGSTTAISVSGVLSSSGATFSPYYYSETSEISITTDGELEATDTTFSLDQVIFASDSVMNPNDLVGDTFNEPLYVPYNDVQYLGQNASFEAIEIANGMLPAGAMLSLDQIGSGSSLSYVFYQGFSVESGAVLDVEPYISVQIGGGETLYDAGTMNVYAGATVSFGYSGGSTTAISVSGVLSSSGATFSPYYDSETSEISITTDGELEATDTTFNLDQVIFASDSVMNPNDLVEDTFNEPLYVPYNDVQYLGQNASLEAIEIANGVLPSGAMLSLDQIGSGSSLSYVFYQGFTVESGAVLDVEPYISVQIGGGETLYDAGTMNVYAGATVSFGYSYGSTTAISVSGVLSSSGATFSPYYYSETSEISITTDGELEATDTTFNLDQVIFASDSVMNPNDLVGDAFNEPLYVPYNDVQYLGQNASLEAIEIANGVLPSGAKLSLDQIGSGSSLSYVFYQGFTVESGAVLDVEPYISVQIGGGETLYDAGTMNVYAGATVNFGYSYGSTTAISVSGVLSSSGATFSPYYDSETSEISITTDGELEATDTTFNLDQVIFASDSVMNPNDLVEDTFNEPLYVPYNDVQYLGQNASLEAIEIANGMLPSGAMLSLLPIGSGSMLSYVFYQGFTVESGALLDVAEDISVQIGGGETLNDAGTMKLRSGDTVSFGYSYGSTTAISVSGVLSSSGATFSPYYYSETSEISITTDGELEATDTTFNLDQVIFASDSVMNPNDLVGDTFNEPLYVPYNDVQYLGQNASFEAIEINGGTIAGGAVSLDEIGTNPANLSYVFYQPFKVASGATLTVGANVPVQIVGGQTITDYGTIDFNSNDNVTFGYASNSTTSINVYGALNVTGADFSATSLNANGSFSQIQVNSGGTLTADDETVFDLSSLVLNSGSTATMSSDVLHGVFTINSNTTLDVSGNDFSNLTSPDGLVAAGIPGSTIYIPGNYWGTDYNGIETIILDSNDNKQLPTVSFENVANDPSGTSAQSQTVTYSPSTTPPDFSLTADVTYDGNFINEGTVYFTILDGTAPIDVTTSSDVVNGSATTTDNMLFPNISPGMYTIDASFSDDGLNNYLPSMDLSHSLTVLPAATITEVNSASATFSSVTDQQIPLSATVTSLAGAVGVGSVTFTVLDDGNPVGIPVVQSVDSNGVASTNFDLMASTAGGTYTIQAVYTDPADFTTSSADSSLVVSAAATSTTMGDTSTEYDATVAEPVALSADVTSPNGVVNGGSVTFTILDASGTPIVSGINAPVSTGVASTTAYLSAGTAVGQVYTIEAVYGGSDNFAASTTPTYSSLVVDAAPTITTAANASASFDPSTQTITLSADVTGNGFAVTEGTVTFTVLNGTTPEGPAVTVSLDMTGGIVSTPYTLDAGVPIGTYIVEAVYDNSTLGDYLGSSDLSHTLTITQPPATQLVIAPGSPSTVTAGQAFAPLVVDEEDANGNIEAGDNTTIVTVTFGGATFTAQVVAGVATFTNVVDDVAGTASLTAASGNLVPGILNGIVVTPAAASQLVVIQQPSASAVANQPFMTQPIVAEEDQYGNILTGDSTSTITAARGTLGTDTLYGPNLTIPLVNGVADFAGLYYNKAELMNISFSTDAPNVSSVTSDTVSVSPSQATQLVVQSGYSTTATAGDPLSNPLVVYEEDKFGNIATGDDSSIVTAIQTTGKGPLTAIDATVSGGIARFTGLTDTRAETTSLQFVSGTIYSTTTMNPIVVSPGAASALVIVTQPGSATAGAPFQIQPEVEVVDAYGNLETSDNTTEVSVTSSNNGTLLGSSPVTVSGGIAQFSGLQDNMAETVTLTFAGSGLTPVTSDSITVVAGAARSLLVTRPPKGVVAGIAFGASIDAIDNYGNVATSFDGQVTAALAAGSDGTLSGTTVMAAVNGEADFTDLISNKSGSIMLAASATASDGTPLSAPATDPIPVVPGVATQLVIAQAPAAGSQYTAGVAFAMQPIVYEEDADYNIVTSDSQTVVTVSSTGAGKLKGGSTTATLNDGVATFSGLLDDTAETIALDFTSPGLKTAVSSTFIIIPAALDHIAIETPLVKTYATAGSPFGTQPVIEEFDQFNNIETGDNTTQIVASLATGTGPLVGNTEETVQGGVATFTDLVDNLAETITLNFSIPGTSYSAGPSSSIVISPAAASLLVISVEPGSSSATAGDALSKIVISEEDANHNIETADNSTVITAAPSTGSAKLEGAQATVTNGVATFTGLIDDTAGTVQLIFTGGGVTSLPSNAITVAPASPYQLVIESEPPTAPATVTAGEPFSAVVWEEDKFTNLETTDNGTQVTASLASGAGPISGTLVTMSGGVATFSDLIDDTAGTITLSFSGGGLSVGPSNDVDIVAASASQLVIKTTPSAPVSAGQSFGAVVWEEDHFHNLVTTDSTTQVTASLDSGTGPLQGAGTPVTLEDGVATFSGLSDDMAGTITLGFTGGGFTAGPSGNVVINPAAIDKLALVQEPSTTVPSTAGQAFPVQPVVYVEDEYGNLETGDNTTSVAPALTGATDVLQNGSPITVTGGIAKFANLADDLAETVALRFTGGGLAAVTSDNFVVNPGAPARLVIATEPSSSAFAGAAFATQPVIVEEDQFGNVERSDNSTPITVSLNTGTGPLQGTTTVSVTGGVVSFSNLADTIAETITLRFTSGSLAAAVSTPITVSTPPGNIGNNAPPAPTPTITSAVVSHGKPKKGKQTLAGFQLFFSASMNPNTVQNPANYSLSAKVKKGKKTSFINVAVKATYNPSNNSVLLSFASSQKFTLGGTLAINSPASGGITSSLGASLMAGYSYTISPNAKTITIVTT